jgi:hypothetical protein
MAVLTVRVHEPEWPVRVREVDRPVRVHEADRRSRQSLRGPPRRHRTLNL